MAVLNTMYEKLKKLQERAAKYYGVTTLFNIYILIFFITLVLLVVQCSKILDYTGDYEPFDEGWVCAGDAISLGQINDSITISHKIPDITQERTIFFRVKNLNVSVYIDDVLYCDYGQLLLRNEHYYKTPGTYYVSVPLGVKDAGKEFRIVIDSPYVNDGSCTITEMYIGSIADIFKYELNSKLFGFSICVIVIALGFVFMCITIPMYKYETVEIGHNLLYLGLFAFLIGVWSLTETKVLQLVTGQSVFVHYLNNLSLMIAVTPLFIFFSKRHKAAKSFTVYIVGGTFILTYVISCILHFNGIYDLHETVKLTQFGLVLSVLFTFYYAYCCLVQQRLKDIAFIGLFFIALCSGLDVFLYYKQVTPDNSTLVRLGVLIYVLVIGTQLIAEYIKAYQKSLKADSWRKKAYTDGLTGLYNRAAFTEHLSRIDAEKLNNKCAILVFDLNELKYINDNFGHSFGDEAIIEAASLISGTFNVFGKCYRIGGDEFVCIFNETISINELSSVCDKFISDVSVSNIVYKDKRPYELAIATGYSFIDYGGAITGKMAFDAADAEMYIKKQRLKRGKKAI